jgi:hypothetical protein
MAESAIQRYVLRSRLDAGEGILVGTAPVVRLHGNLLVPRHLSPPPNHVRQVVSAGRVRQSSPIVGAVAEILEEGAFDVAEYADELAVAPANLDVGTSILYENDRVKVWEVHLPPGTRGPFHAHTHPYFWTCVDPGVGRQRAPDGTMKVRRYERGETLFSDHSPEDPMLHDLENVGESSLRFITVELLA